MTHPSTVADTLAPVIAADRIAAADLRATTPWSREQYLAGKMDKKPAVQAFARHRIAMGASLLEALEAFAVGEIDVSGTALIYDADVRAMQQLARTAIAKARGEVQP